MDNIPAPDADADATTYRVEIDRAIKLILCVRPRITFVNGIFGSGKTYFSERFKSEGFNVISLDKIYARMHKIADAGDANIVDAEMRRMLVTDIQTHLQRFEGSVPVIIEGFVRNPMILHEIFTNAFELFTYVFMYPNNPKRYKDRLLQAMVVRNWSFEHTPYSFPPHILDDQELKKLRTSGKGANTVVKKLIETNRMIYEEHLKAFDHRIVTVLN
jgi:hypothetical protein